MSDEMVSEVTITNEVTVTSNLEEEINIAIEKQGEETNECYTSTEEYFVDCCRYKSHYITTTTFC